MSDAVENLEIEPEPQPEPTPEPAPEPTPEPEPSPEDKPEDQGEDEAARIRRLAFESREAKRQAKEAEERAKELEEKLKANAQPERPVVPPKPTDQYDENYEKLMDEYMEAKAAQKVYDERVAWEERQRAEQQQAAHQAAIQKQQQKNMEYFDRGEKLGINQLELGQASEAINTFQLHQDVVDHLLNDPRGPEMAIYLKDNPGELLKVAELSPMQAGIYLETEVKPKSKREPPQVAPPPVETDTGSSVTETDDGFTLE